MVPASDLKLNRNDLLSLWVAMRRGDSTAFAPGKALEYLIIRSFELEQCRVEYAFEVNLLGNVIEQIDGFVEIEGTGFLCECKDTPSHNVSFDPIAKMVARLNRRPSSDVGAIIATSEFTEPALVLANFTFPRTVLLWNVDEIEYALKKQYFRAGMKAKLRQAQMRGISDYNIMVEE